MFNGMKLDFFFILYELIYYQLIEPNSNNSINKFFYSTYIIAAIVLLIYSCKVIFTTMYFI